MSGQCGEEVRTGRSERFALIAIVAAGFGLGLLAVPPMLPDLDAVNFSRALVRFDLATQAPHFPGYPLYVGLCRVFAWLGAPPNWALSLPGLVLMPFGVFALSRVVLARAGAAAGLVCAVVLSFSPLAMLLQSSPSSDGAGFAALCLALAGALAGIAPSAHPARSWAAGLVAGLALGIRPSYAPAVIGLVAVVPSGHRTRWAMAALVGVAAWLVPLVAFTGPGRFLEVATRFASGHASDWGGTIAASPDLGERLTWLGFDIAAAGVGAVWARAFSVPRLLLTSLLLVLFVALAKGALRRRLSEGERAVAFAGLALGLPYAAWTFLGQNLLKARHALPLVLAVALLAAAGAVVLLARSRWRTVGFAGALASALVAISAPLALAQGGAPSPAASLVRFVSEALPASGVMLFTGEEARLFEAYAPQYRAGRFEEEELKPATERLAAAGVEVFVTSAAPGVEGLRPRLTPIAEFSCSPLVHSHASHLTLYRFSRAREPL